MVQRMANTTSGMWLTCLHQRLSRVRCLKYQRDNLKAESGLRAPNFGCVVQQLPREIRQGIGRACFAGRPWGRVYGGEN
jgi:hypothetical protein